MERLTVHALRACDGRLEGHARSSPVPSTHFELQYFEIIVRIIAGINLSSDRLMSLDFGEDAIPGARRTKSLNPRPQEFRFVARIPRNCNSALQNACCFI